MSQQPLQPPAAPVTINGISIDPSGPKRSRDSRDTNYIYLTSRNEEDENTYDSGFTTDQLQQLKDLGAQVYERVGDTYLCRYEPTDLTPLRNLDFVNVANCYHTTFKVPQPVLNVIEEANQGIGTLELEDNRQQAAPSPINLNLILHATATNEAVEQIAASVKEIPGVDQNSVQVLPGLITVSATPTAVEAIKRLDEIRTVARQIPAALCNNVATIDMHAKPVTLPQSQYRGEGQTVSVNDTGFDLGSIEDVHPDFVGRVKAVIPLAGTSSGRDDHSHGTHVAGSVLGSGFSETMGGRIEGTAPAANLVMQRISNEKGALTATDSYIPLLQGPYDTYHSRISCNSWGPDWQFSPYQITYDQSARARSIDQYVWDHPDQVVCVAAGNDGRVTTSDAQIGDSAAAKNCITVGSTYSSRPSKGGSSFNATSLNPSDPTVIAVFSSRGPVKDDDQDPNTNGRTKPDITAPGVAILSTFSRSDLVPVSQKTIYGISSDPLYVFKSGTSMATPLVAGCCAVLRQMADANGLAEPSAALVKALLINGAMANGESHDDRSKANVSPSSTFGFGRVDLERAMILPNSNHGGVFDEKNGTGPTRTWARFFSVTTQSTVKVTLVWSDPPGSSIQNRLYLDVCLLRPPQLLIPIGKAFNRGDVLNNVQQVIVHGLDPGTRYAARVTAGTFVKGGIQPFAVVWSISE